MEFPSAGGWTHNIIPALHNGGRNVPDLVHIVQNPSIGGEPPPINKVMATYMQCNYIMDKYGQLNFLNYARNWYHFH